MAVAKNRMDSLVGHEVYDTWTAMLSELVPWGRTQRLSVLVAGMLQYATSLASDSEDSEEEGSVAWRLLCATETSDTRQVEGLLFEIAGQLFRDAGVEHYRTNYSGTPYSIIEEAIEEYVRWEDMPWE